MLKLIYNHLLVVAKEDTAIVFSLPADSRLNMRAMGFSDEFVEGQVTSSYIG
jgi:hypothetical protein